MIGVDLSNIVLKECNQFLLNEYFLFKNNECRNGISIECIEDEKETFESSHSILKHAIDLAFPEIEVTAFCKEGYPIWITRPILTNLTSKRFDKKEIFEISNDKITHLKEWFGILLEYSTSTKQNWHTIEGTWNLTFNEYINAITSLKVEKAYIHLINALEAALSQENSERRYKISLYASILYTDDLEKRKEAFQLLKKAYEIRSKLRNEIPLNKDDIFINNLYQGFFKLKEIVSTVLLKTYNTEKKDVIEKIEDAIFTCRAVL